MSAYVKTTSALLGIISSYQHTASRALCNVQINHLALTVPNTQLWLTCAVPAETLRQGMQQNTTTTGSNPRSNTGTY